MLTVTDGDSLCVFCVLCVCFETEADSRQVEREHVFQCVDGPSETYRLQLCATSSL